MIALLLPPTVFFGIRDLDVVLPKYEEHTLFVPPPKEFSAIQTYLDRVGREAVQRMQDGDFSLLAQFTWAKQGAWDMAALGDEVDGFRLPPIAPPASGMFPKEEALLRLIAQEKRAGRKVLVYVSQINRRDVTGRLCNLMRALRHARRGPAR